MTGSWHADTNRSAVHGALPRFNQLAIATGKTVKQHSPDTPLLGPGAFPGFTAFVESFAQSGALEYLDAFSVHPYRNCDWPEHALPGWSSLRQALSGGSRKRSSNSSHRRGVANNTRDDSDSSRGATIPLVSSEWGYSALWPTAVMRKNEGKDIFDPASPTGCDEALQAKFLPRMWLTNLMQGVRLSIWYNFKDGRLASGAGADQSHFGLVRADPAPSTAEGGQTEGYHWPPKQGFFAARAFTRLLAGRALVDTCANLSWWAAAVPPLPQPPPLPPHPRPPATMHCRKLNVSGAAADNSFVLTFDRLFDGAHRNSTVAAASGGSNESRVIVFWCADVTRLPCALTLSPVLLEKPLGTSTNGTVRDGAHEEAGWPVGVCFEQRSFTGELLDPVCTVAADNGAGGSVLKVFADNAPTYLSTRVHSKQLSTVHHART